LDEKMPKLATPLTEEQIESLLPKARSFIIGDGGGLYLEVTPTGAKLWRMAYRRGGKETSITFGPYPSVSLTEARQHRDSARRLIDEGIDPVDRRRKQGKPERASIAIKPRLRLSMSDDGSLTLEKRSGRLTLSAAQVTALRSFLSATTDDDTGAPTCPN
jgi:hypothetical protein